jgi:hypothetical protein
MLALSMENLLANAAVENPPAIGQVQIVDVAGIGRASRVMD